MKYLLDESPLVILPSLAATIGLNEAIVLQQVHYWMQNPNVGQVVDGRKWIYNSYPQWKENFPFWSLRTIQGIFLKLEDKALLDATTKFNTDPRDRTKWYSINYKWYAQTVGGADSDDHSANPAYWDAQGLRHGHAKSAHSSTKQILPTETTTETTSVAPKRKKAQPTTVGDDWIPNDDTGRWMLNEGFTHNDLTRELPKFLDHHLSRGNTFVDWNRAFKNWMRNSKNWNTSGNGKGKQANPEYIDRHGNFTVEGAAAHARGEI